MYRQIKLICTSDGHNKYYTMEQPVKGATIKTTYGRIGSTTNHGTKNPGEWDKVVREKVAKGYIDTTGTAIQEFSLEEMFKNLDKLEAKFS